MNLQTLESAKFLHRDDQSRCLCCDALHSDGVLCGNCHAPLELTRTVRARGVPPKFVAVLGASGAGKTVYLGVLLDMLSNGGRGLKGFASGAFSVALQQQTMAALEGRRFPEKTPIEADQWNWVHCQLSHQDRPKEMFDIVTPDLAGEALAVEVQRPGAFPAIQHLVRKARGVVLLCDSQRACHQALDEDLFGLQVLTYLASQVDQVGGGKRRRRGERPPVAVVFTKSDLCPEVRHDPRRFAADNLPRMTQFTVAHPGEYGYFAAGVVGSSATLIDSLGCQSQVAFHLEPQGIVDPLEWIVRSAK